MSGNLRTLPRALREAAASGHGYHFVPGGHEVAGVSRSYAELRDASIHSAHALRQAVVTRGDLVALVIGDAEPFLTSLFGASIAGLVPASLHPPATTRDLDAYLDLTARVLRAARAKALVTSAALVEGFERIRAACPDLRVVLPCERVVAGRQPGDVAGLRQGDFDEPSLDDLAFVQFTSGATSEPKGVALTHRNLCANVNAINGPHGLATTGADSAVSWLPLHHDMGLVGMALCPLYASRPAVFLPTQAFVRRPAEWLRAISRHRATVSFAPNFAYDLCVRRVKDVDVAGVDLSCWRVAGCGAEPIHAPTLAAFADRFAAVGFRETSFLTGYGLAEHVVAATFAPRGRPLRTDGEFVSCGRALPDHAVKIVDERFCEVAERGVGEITLAGPSVMQGYYENSELTRETIHDGWLRTGDLGYLADGELYVCGRAKDLIIANGRKYYPQDLEWGIDDLAGVRRGHAVAFGTAHDYDPDRVVIVVERNGTVDAEQLVHDVRRRMADLHALYVDDVVIAPSGTVTRTTSGKVQRVLIKARYERGELTRRSTP
jgi:acyl-CoA synthetase (AMP-forming)/AMP-acid ligase II